MPIRDVSLEAELLAFAAELAERAYGVSDCGPFIRAVESRLAAGESLYGDQWAARDNLAEAREEAFDGAAYALLELQRLDGDEYDELRMLAVGMIAAAMNFDLATRRFIAERSNL